MGPFQDIMPNSFGFRNTKLLFLLAKPCIQSILTMTSFPFVAGGTRGRSDCKPALRCHCTYRGPLHMRFSLLKPCYTPHMMKKTPMSLHHSAPDPLPSAKMYVNMYEIKYVSPLPKKNM